MLVQETNLSRSAPLAYNLQSLPGAGAKGQVAVISGNRGVSKRVPCRWVRPDKGLDQKSTPQPLGGDARQREGPGLQLEITSTSWGKVNSKVPRIVAGALV